MEDLNLSLNQYRNQLTMVKQTLESANDVKERQSLLALQSDLQQLIQLTEESVAALSTQDTAVTSHSNVLENDNNALDEEYALFMQEMAGTSAYEAKNHEQNQDSSNENKQCEDSDDSDIEAELARLAGMRCSVRHAHAWGGAARHGAMVSAVLPHSADRFQQLQVRVLFTHPTHTEMLPCPFYLEGECRFSDEQCRYSHGEIVQLSDLKEAIEPNFASLKIGSRVLMKLKPPDDEDISLTRKCTEKYHLWHRAVLKDIDLEKKTCIAKLEHGITTGEKRKAGSDEYHVRIEDIFPLNTENDEDSESSDDSLSDTEYPDSKSTRTADDHHLIAEKSLQNNIPVMGEWERHTRGIGSKLMLAMGYVPGRGLGARGAGRVRPVEAGGVVGAGGVGGRGGPTSLDRWMARSEQQAARDPLEVEQKLKRLQKKEEERNKRAYEREKERERKNVFNFINSTLGDKPEQESSNATAAADVKQSTSKDLNIEQFKIEEDTKRIERDIIKLNNSLEKYPPGSNGHRSISIQIVEKTKEQSVLQRRGQQIAKEQRHRKDKQKMTVF